jgi:UDP-2,3-diacylglucosamine hydrolase
MAEIHTGPHITEIGGRRLYLCHGDQLNPADYGYRFLRFMLRNQLAAAAVRAIPLPLAVAIKEKLQHTSRSTYQFKSTHWDYRQIIRDAAAVARQQGCSGIVTGHFHLAWHEELISPPEASTFTILSLGDWMNQFTYGEMLGGELKLLTYSGEAGQNQTSHPHGLKNSSSACCPT